MAEKLTLAHMECGGLPPLFLAPPLTQEGDPSQRRKNGNKFTLSGAEGLSLPQNAPQNWIYTFGASTCRTRKIHRDNP